MRSPTDHVGRIRGFDRALEFSVIEEDPTEEDAQGLVRCGMALDDQAGSGWLGGGEGPLCGFTAAGSGTLILDLWLSWVDEAGQTIYESYATESYDIAD